MSQRQQILAMVRRPGGLASNDRTLGKASKYMWTLMMAGDVFAARFVGVKTVWYFGTEQERDDYVRKIGKPIADLIPNQERTRAFSGACADVVELSKRPQGVGASEAAKVLGINTNTAHRAVQRLCFSGAIHRAQKGAKDVRYFASAADALKYGPPRIEVDAPVTVRLSKAWRNAPEDRSAARMTIAPPPRDRWDAKATYQPIFSAMKPGQYLSNT